MNQFLHMDSLPCLENWFPLIEVSRKRHYLADIIRRLSKQQQGKKCQWPDLKFLEPHKEEYKFLESEEGGEDEKTEEIGVGIVSKKELASQETVHNSVSHQDKSYNFLADSRVRVRTPLASSSLARACSCSPCSRGSRASCSRRGRVQERKQNIVNCLQGAENRGSLQGVEAEIEAKGKRQIEQIRVFDIMGKNKDTEEEDVKHEKAKPFKIQKNVNSLPKEAKPLKIQERTRTNLALKEFKSGADDLAKKRLGQNLKSILLKLEEDKEMLPSLKLKSVPKKEVDS